MGSNTLDGSLETFSVQKVFQNKEGVEEEARERFLPSGAKRILGARTSVLVYIVEV